MRNIFILLVFMSLSFNLVSADDQQLPQVCGGDSELVIGCLGDQELIFLGGIAPSSIGGLSTGISAESTNVSSKTVVVIPKEEKAKKPSSLYLIPIILFLCFLIFVYKRRKDKKEKERERKEREKSKNLNSSTA